MMGYGPHWGMMSYGSQVGNDERIGRPNMGSAI